ncbi:TPA: hypothetical protein I7721_19685 [Vibrio vulnificus]|nr:hypothetical protein [Vibrio vulnificus]
MKFLNIKPRKQFFILMAVIFLLAGLLMITTVVISVNHYLNETSQISDQEDNKQFRDEFKKAVLRDNQQNGI